MNILIDISAYNKNVEQKTICSISILKKKERINTNSFRLSEKNDNI